MPSYLVETYLARTGAQERLAGEQRARAAAAEATHAGASVRFDRSIHVPDDEICFYVFEAPSAHDAELAARGAGLAPIRVVEAVSSAEEER